MSNKKEYVVLSSESRTKIEDMMNDAFDDGYELISNSGFNVNNNGIGMNLIYTAVMKNRDDLK